jgi:hypothetical protein
MSRREKPMELRKLAKLWQLGIAAGMLFGFGSNAMEVLVPLTMRPYLKATLLTISGLLILSGYAQLRSMERGSDAEFASLSVRDDADGILPQ